MVHSREPANLRRSNWALRADHPSDGMDFRWTHRMFRPGQKNVHFNGHSKRGYQRRVHVDTAAPQIATIPVAAMYTASIVLPREHNGKPQWVTECRSSFRHPARCT